VAAVAGRIDWKYALGLELDPPGFDNSVLAEFRVRLVGNDLARLAFDRLWNAAVNSDCSSQGTSNGPIPHT
jgi:transposase